MKYLNQEFFGNSIENWIIAISLLFGSFFLIKIIYWIFSNVFTKITSKTKNNLDDVLIKNLKTPFVFLVVIGSYYFSIKFLNFSPKIEEILISVSYLLFTVSLTSIFSRIIDSIISEIILPISEKTESSFDNYLIPIIQKVVRTIIWSFGIIIGLDNIGFDITAMIAGLGIGGLALALAAQDSIKNIFAGIMIF